MYELFLSTSKNNNRTSTCKRDEDYFSDQETDRSSIVRSAFIPTQVDSGPRHGKFKLSSTQLISAGREFCQTASNTLVRLKA